PLKASNPRFPQFSATSTLCACSIVEMVGSRTVAAIRMDNWSDHEQLQKLSEAAVCPNCGETISPGSRQVYGGGVFCSLGCVAEYNAAELIERHRRIVAAIEQHRRS